MLCDDVFRLRIYNLSFTFSHKTPCIVEKIFFSLLCQVRLFSSVIDRAETESGHKFAPRLTPFKITPSKMYKNFKFL